MILFLHTGLKHINIDNKCLVYKGFIYMIKPYLINSNTLLSAFAYRIFFYLSRINYRRSIYETDT